MSINLRNYFLLFFLAVLLPVYSPSIFAQDKKWREITPAELQMTVPQVEPDADAEAIFWEVRFDDRHLFEATYEHYVRVKIFTERGRERFSKFDIPYSDSVKLKDIAVRIIKPDGSVYELQEKDIFDREIARAGKVKIKAKSFAVAKIEPGVIIEYRYKEIESRFTESVVFVGFTAVFGSSEIDVAGQRLVFQRDIPIQKLTYYIRPKPDYMIKSTSYNMPEVSFVKDPDNKDFSFATVTNVPALKDEPYMPPPDAVRRWVYFSYRKKNKDTPEGDTKVWQNLAAYYSRQVKDLSTPSRKIKQKADELTANASSEEDKLKRIYDFTQKNIRNMSLDNSLNQKRREEILFYTMDDVLEKGVGFGRQIKWMFASLAAAAGFEVNFYLSGDRRENFFNPDKHKRPEFLQRSGVAVKIGNQWRYFNPAVAYMPYGKLVWYDERNIAMQIAEKEFYWVKIPPADALQSSAKRTGKFKLLEDGTLEGTVKFEYDGHQAVARRLVAADNSYVKQEEDIKNEVKERASTAKVSDISIENVGDNTKPLIYIFKIRVPGYAQKTGKRLFLQPGFFEYGAAAAFSSATRTHDVYFPYPWSEQDTVEIELPKGFVLDNADVPKEIADAGNVAGLKISLSLDKAANMLRYQRRFHFGGNNKILFPASAYEPLKKLFDVFHKADTHVIALKQA